MENKTQRFTAARRLGKTQNGQDLIEYTLIMALVALISAAIFLGAGGSLFKPVPTVDVHVEIGGTGFGSIIALTDTGNRVCGESCTWQYPQGTVITFAAAADSGSTIKAWGEDAGLCKGNFCKIGLAGNKKVTITFEGAR